MVMNFIKALDKHVITKFIQDNNSVNNDPEIKKLIPDFEVFKSAFKERNGWSLEEILKKYTANDSEKVYPLISISKAVELYPASEGIAYALSIVLHELYRELKWYIDRFTRDFSDADLIRSLNLYNAFLKIVKDDLRFITFNNGSIATLPITQTIKKCYDDYYYNENYIDDWEVEDMNQIKKSLDLSGLLLNTFLLTIPQNPEYEFFIKIIESFLQQSIDLNNNFANIVMMANSIGTINVAEKPPTQYIEPTIFYNQTTQKNMKKAYDVELIKKNEDFEGYVTGIVLSPETVDLQGHIVSKEEIRSAMVDFMKNYQQFDVMHDLNVLKSKIEDGDSRQVVLVQNFIAPQDLIYDEKVVKEGTWLQENLLLDEEIKKQIANGTLKGYSIYGTANIQPV